MRESRPVQRIEVNEKNTKLRWIAVVALLVIGIIGMTIGVMGMLNNERGWQQIQLNLRERNCSENFVFQYDFSGTGVEASAVNSKLLSIYEEACIKGYQLFTPDDAIDGVHNVYYVNHNPNQEIVVDPVLYQAFQKLEGTPYLQLGALYAHYYNVILNADESMVAELDPVTSSDAKDHVAKLAAFAADEEHIRLELLGENRVRLHVSQEYLDFAADEEMEVFIDFAYMTNAFIIDYLAEMLTEQGLTSCFIVSNDGYTRNLDSKHRFNYNIFDRMGNLINCAAVMEYQGPASIVFLKDYPTANSDAHYRSNGEHILHLFADPADGICRTSVDNLVSYAYDTGCVDVMLKMLPSFVGSSFAVPDGVFSIWCEDETICYNDDRISFSNLQQDATASYSLQFMN